MNENQVILEGTNQADIITNRDNALEAVNTAQRQVAQAETNLTKAQVADTNRQQAIDNVQQAVDEVTKTVAIAKSDLATKTAQANKTQATADAKQANVATAQKDVNDKQAILDGTGSQDIINEQASAQQDEFSKKATVQTAQVNLIKAQRADKERLDKIANAQTALETSLQDLEASQADEAVKQSTVNKTQVTLKTAQSIYKIAENDYKAINTITMSAEYAKALKDAFDYSLTREQRDAAKETLKRLAESEGLKNSFIHNENDKTQSFDINHVIAKQATELSLFVADLINQARKVVGTPLVEVTAESAVEAQNHANYYATTDMTTWTFKHDTKDLDTKYGWVDEDWAGGLGLKQVSNLDEAKERIYQNALVGWIFNKNEWLHASSVVGTRNATEGNSYVGIGFSKLKDGGDSINLNIFNTKLSNLSNFDSIPLVNIKSSEKVTATYNTAKSDLAKAHLAYNVALSDLGEVQSRIDAIIDAMDGVSQVLAKAHAVPVQTPTAQATLAVAQTAYQVAAERLITANKAVDELNADIKTKQVALIAAQAALDAAKSELAQAQADNDMAQGAKRNAQTAYDSAVFQLVSANATLTQAQAAPTQVPTATATLVAAQTAYQTAQERLTKANEAVTNLNADVKQKQANLVAAKQVLAEKQVVLNTKVTALTSEQAKMTKLQTALVTAKQNVIVVRADVDKTKAVYEAAQARLAKLQNAPQALKEAQARLATAKTNFLAALDSLQSELEILQELKNKQATAQANYGIVSAVYQKGLDVKVQDRLQVEYDCLVAQGQQPTPVVDETGKITGYTILAPEASQLDSTVQEQAVTEAKSATVPPPTATKLSAPTTNAVTKQTSNNLPVTSDTTSIVAIFFGAVLALFGLVGARKKETK